jgi:hypothetical protein
MKNITLHMLSSPDCHNCALFREFWSTIKDDWVNVTFSEISLTSPEGQKMVKKHQIFVSPGIILDGVLVSTGPVREESFVKKLNEVASENA